MDIPESSKSKGKRKVEEIESTDDYQEITDYKSPLVIGKPLEALVKKGVTVTTDEDSFPSLTSRCSPAALVQSLDALNSIQRDEVREMGFGNLLDLRIKKLPNKLIYWLVENYEPISSQLIISQDQRLDVLESDVERVFGFPRGELIIGPKKAQNRAEVIEEWVDQFTQKSIVKNKHKILPRHVGDAMLREKSGGLWFKRHFLVLLSSSLIESLKHGYVYPCFDEPLQDTSRVKEWNWCEYVIRSLIDSTISWKQDKSDQYGGPSLFLVILYVNRIRIYNQTIKRQLPLINNWDCKELRKRQNLEIDSGGFGRGRIVPESEMLLNKESDDKLDEFIFRSPIPKKNLFEFSSKCMEQAERACNEFIKLTQLLREAPHHVSDDVYSLFFLPRHTPILRKSGCDTTIRVMTRHFI